MSGFHIAYSNSYEVLRAELLEALARRVREPSDDVVFSSLEIVSASKEIDNDIRRAVSRHTDFSGVCIGLRFERLDDWLAPYGKFWRESSIGAVTLPWKIFSILKAIKTGELSFRPEFKPLIDYLHQSQRDTRSYDVIAYALSRKIAAVFTKYVNYRLDWVLEWLGAKTIGAVAVKSIRSYERELLAKDTQHVAWQKALWQEIQREESQRGKKKTFEAGHCTEFTQELLDLVKGNVKRTTVNTTPLYVFLPRSLPPLCLPILASEALRRDVTLFILNPCREYWFDPMENSVPLSLFSEWKTLPGENALLHGNAMSTRAFIDRLWQFMPDDELREAYLPIEDFPKTPREISTLWAGATYNPKANSFILPETGNVQQSFCWVERKVRAPNTSLTLLEAVANSVLRDSALRSEADATTHFVPEELDKHTDVSVRIAGASTLAREIEGLVDWINAIRERDCTIAGEDILVVTPDIGEAAPLIRGVLNALPKHRRIDYQIVGVADVGESVSLAFGDFLFSRASYDDFMELLNLPLFAETWQLQDEEICLIGHWLSCAGYRAAINERHWASMLERGVIVQGYKQEGSNDGTLERALERLSFGFMSGSGAVFGDTRSIAGSEGRLFESESVCAHRTTFEKLLRIYALLTTWGDENGQRHERTWEQNRTLADWASWCEDLSETVFGSSRSRLADRAKTAFTKAYRKTLKAIAEGFTHERVSFDAFWLALRHTINEGVYVSQREGAVTFAGMRDLRHLPFKAIAMIGMNENANFPGENISEEFDLTMTLRDANGVPCRRRGDRDSRSENRNIFLDILLAARRFLLISYTSGFEPEVSPQPPSILVQEFLQWLRSEGIDTRLLCYTLPLTRYSQRQFLTTDSPDARFFNATDEVACTAAKNAGLDPVPRFVPQNVLAVYETSEADLELSEAAFLDKPVLFKDFVEAWLNPERFILNKLGLREENEVLDVESAGFFLPKDQLFQYRLKKDFYNQVDPESFAKALALDPQYGFCSLRSEFLEGFLEDGRAFRKERDRILAQRTTRELDGLEYRIALAGGRSLLLKLPTLTWVDTTAEHQEDDRHEGFVYKEALSGVEKKRFGLLRLVLRAMDITRTRLVAERTEYEKYQQPKIGEVTFSYITKKQNIAYAPCIDPHQLPINEVQAVLEAIGAFYVALMKRLVLVVANPQRPTLLTRGASELFARDFPKLVDIQQSWIFGAKEFCSRKPTARQIKGNAEVVSEARWVVRQIENILRQGARP